MIVTLIPNVRSNTFQNEFIPGPLDQKYRSQAFCIRERKPYPQLIATSRHITCGGADLNDLQWDGKRLTGRSVLVAHDPYIVYLTEPAGFGLEKFECPQLPAGKIEREGILLKITLLPEKSGDISWTATYSR